MIISYKDMLQV